MSNIYIEQRDKKYVALQNKQVIAKGDTQREAAESARKKKPNDPILAEHLRNTKGGTRDKWRRFYV